METLVPLCSWIQVLYQENKVLIDPELSAELAAHVFRRCITARLFLLLVLVVPLYRVMHPCKSVFLTVQ